MVVDVGGAQGHIAMALARQFGNLRIVVEDMEKVIEGCEVPHDLFAAQTVKGDVYLLRWVLHNWPDCFCIRILQVSTAILIVVFYASKVFYIMLIGVRLKSLP